MNPTVAEEAAKAAVFAELQAQFLADVPPEHQGATTEQHQKIATAAAKIASVLVQHIQTFAQATGTVTTAVSTVVATAGSAVAQAGTGTGTGSGTAVITPGGIT